MIDDFNELYDSKKNNLFDEMCSSEDLTVRKSILDEFFGRIEKES